MLQAKATSPGAGAFWSAIGREPRKAPRHMQLSVPELECAYSHAMAVYGDLEDYVGELA